MTEYENAVEIRNLTKKYDGFTLDNVSFNVAKGNIMGFIGQNGAGKTTTIKSLLNIIKTDGGSISMLGMDMPKDETEIKNRIAAIFDEMPFHDDLTGNQLAVIMEGLFGSFDRNTYFDYLDIFALPRRKKIAKFSKGMKMKLQIAAALSHNAELLIMDEATTGLDPVVRNEILDIFREYLENENRSILMSSHITSDLEKIADSITFIDKGKILLTGVKDDILASHGVIKCSKADYKKISPDDIISARLNDFGAEIMVSDKEKAREKYSGLTVDGTTLEEIMLFYVNREKKEWS